MLTVLRQWLCQRWCWVRTRHLRVTKSGGGRRQERCYLCDAPLSDGWDFRSLEMPPAPPRPRSARRRRRLAIVKRSEVA